MDNITKLNLNGIIYYIGEDISGKANSSDVYTKTEIDTFLEDINTSFDTKIYTPTLNSIPTSSTLTYTENGETYDFIVGQFCRVTDVNSDTGYTFYQLYDILTLNDSSVAVWYEIGTPPMERVRVTLKSDSVAAPSKLRNEAIVTVTSTKDGVVYDDVVPNDGITIAKIEPNDSYTVEAGDVVGWIAPSS